MVWLVCPAKKRCSPPVGAAGGLGGFFPPLVLGLLKDQVGSFTPGFVLLALFALICLGFDRRFLINRKVAPLPA